MSPPILPRALLLLAMILRSLHGILHVFFSWPLIYLPTLPYLTNADSLVIQIPTITHYFLNDSKSHWKWALLSCKLCHE